MNVRWIERDEATNIIRGYVLKTDVVLDIGPGVKPQSYFRPYLHIYVEPYLPYIERFREICENDPTYLFLNNTWENVMRMLPSKSVDSVFALDVIEHLPKSEGVTFLKEAERVARRQIMIYTPLGFYPQSYDDPEKHDRWGMSGGFWQTHRSGWQIEDFDDRWDLICCKAYHLVDQDEQLLEKPFGALWAFLNLTQITSQSGITSKYTTRLQSKSLVGYSRHVVDKLMDLVRNAI